MKVSDFFNSNQQDLSSKSLRLAKCIIPDLDPPLEHFHVNDITTLLSMYSAVI